MLRGLAFFLAAFFSFSTANGAVSCAPLSASSYANWDGLNLSAAAARAHTAQIALVIGNNYTFHSGALGIPKLSNAQNDAQTMADLLQSKNYHVVCLFETRRDELLTAVDYFSSIWIGLQNSNIVPQGVIYFAGHGGETPTGSPFILPADFIGADDQTLEPLSLNTVLEYLPDNNSQGRYAVAAPIIMIDACRTKEVDASSPSLAPTLDKVLHPYKSAAGLGYLASTDASFQLVFSTSAGKPAGDGQPIPNGNGAFVSAFRDHLNDHPWDKIVDPDLGLFIKDLRTTMQAVPDGQVPSNLLAALMSASDYLWVVDRSDTASYYQWRYGKLEGAGPDACSDIVGDIEHLDSVQGVKGGGTWVSGAAQAFHKFSNDNCSVAAAGASFRSASTPVAEPDVALHDGARNVVSGTVAATVPSEPTLSPSVVAGMPALHMPVFLAGGIARAAAPVAKPSRTSGGPTTGDISSATNLSEYLARIAVKDRPIGVPVMLKADHQSVLLVPKGGGAPTRITLDQFLTDDFEVDCLNSSCAPKSVFVTSRLNGISGYLNVADINARPVSTFGAAIDGASGHVAPVDFAKIAEFLDAAHSNSVVVAAAEISIVDAHHPPVPSAQRDTVGAFDFAERLRDFVARNLVVSPELVTVLHEVQPLARAEPCLNTGISGYCLMIEVVQTPIPKK